jgi:hypothetical protein
LTDQRRTIVVLAACRREARLHSRFHVDRNLSPAKPGFTAAPSLMAREGHPMLVTTESKAQGWRAVAVFDDRADALLFVGRSSTQVRQMYAEAFAEVLDEEEREHVTTIQLQQWSGAPDAGRWVLKTTLKVPVPAAKLRLAA